MCRQDLWIVRSPRVYTRILVMISIPYSIFELLNLLFTLSRSWNGKRCEWHKKKEKNEKQFRNGKGYKYHVEDGWEKL